MRRPLPFFRALRAPEDRVPGRVQPQEARTPLGHEGPPGTREAEGSAGRSGSVLLPSAPALWVAQWGPWLDPALLCARDAGLRDARYTRHIHTRTETQGFPRGPSNE